MSNSYPKYMIATIKINLGEALSADELMRLLDVSRESGRAVDQLVLDAVRVSLETDHKEEAA
jgi:hypothetical protein